MEETVVAGARAPDSDATGSDTVAGTPGVSGAPQGDPVLTLSVEQDVRHRNMLHLIQLRWIAVLGQVATIIVATLLYDISLPMPQMSEVLACLIAFNIASHLRWHDRTVVSNRALGLALLVDVATLTALLYLSGGVTNPFVFLYLLQVILGALLLKPSWSWGLVAITGLCFAALTRYHLPLDFPPGDESGLPGAFAEGILICFALNACLLVFFITRIARNLRERDARLAQMRQLAAEQEHIVRMGLLASGAAHELGTPLATLAVILGDWKYLPAFQSNPELLQDVAEMQAQVQRCKSIVSGILLSAGETRGESSSATTLVTFLDDLVADWRASRSASTLEFEKHLDRDWPMVAEATLTQMICNLLDNAYEASPRGLRLEATVQAGQLVLTVSDEGPGFTSAMLEEFGKPYQSSKGRPGSGLGLFLSVNVTRTLGGTLTAANRPEGGAVVTVTLPLAGMILPEDESDGP